MTRETTTFDSQWVGDLSESPYCDQTLLRPHPPPCDSDYPYRSADGTCNNLKNPTWGAAFTQFRRAMPPDYGDGERVLWEKEGRKRRRFCSGAKDQKRPGNLVEISD